MSSKTQPDRAISAKYMRKLYYFVFLVVVFMCTVCTSDALKLDWLPSSGEGPLPLSRAYREKLARLCQQVEERERDDKALAPELVAKRHVIDAMCAKLQSDNDNIAAGGREDTMKVGQKGVMLLVVVVLVVQLLQTEFVRRLKRRGTELWQRWRYTAPWAGRRGRGADNVTCRRADQGSVSVSGDSQKMAAELAEREARIRRFAAPLGVVSSE